MSGQRMRELENEMTKKRSQVYLKAVMRDIKKYFSEDFYVYTGYIQGRKV